MMSPAQMLDEAMAHHRGIKGYLEDIEFQIIHRALEKSHTKIPNSRNYGVSGAAEILKINRTTLSMRILLFMKKGYYFTYKNEEEYV